MGELKLTHTHTNTQIVYGNRNFMPFFYYDLSTLEGSHSAREGYAVGFDQIEQSTRCPKLREEAKLTETSFARARRCAPPRTRVTGVEPILHN